MELREANFTFLINLLQVIFKNLVQQLTGCGNPVLSSSLHRYCVHTHTPNKMEKN